MEKKQFVEAYVNLFGVTKKSASEMYRISKANKEFIAKIIKAES